MLDHHSHRNTDANKKHMPPRIKSSELLKGSKVLLIKHKGQDYELRLTHSQKLILTK